ncbi:hypothetical protein Hypma_000377 [Hypsizygus marmoreus]|uniref:Uncharacterized protein n=1 Tax=Hypsizygus marmoreus TaxID=39966 RepID=A0A369J8H9_HYPMA|nr:hypothetical protein Hypma_000377 [Hypsizygus marmoreus]
MVLAHTTHVCDSPPSTLFSPSNPPHADAPPKPPSRAKTHSPRQISPSHPNPRRPTKTSPPCQNIGRPSPSINVHRPPSRLPLLYDGCDLAIFLSRRVCMTFCIRKSRLPRISAIHPTATIQQRRVTQHPCAQCW